jgi:glutamate-1-semialdehyde 2,1-aminomutase
MFGFYFLNEPGAAITDYATARQHAHTQRYARFFHAMLDQGVYFAPSQFEAAFMSSAHTEADITDTITKAAAVMGELAAQTAGG